MKNIIYLIGRPGSGKYSIAKEMKKYDYVICDNHLINNPIFSLLDLGSAKNDRNEGGGLNENLLSLHSAPYAAHKSSAIPDQAWSAVDKIRSAVFDFVKIELNSDSFRKNGFVFTNVLYEGEGYDAMVYKAVERIAEGHNFVPVKLILSSEENLRRIKSRERIKMHKSVNPESLQLDKKLIDISHPNLLELDVTNMSASDAAAKIWTCVS